LGVGKWAMGWVFDELGMLCTFQNAASFFWIEPSSLNDFFKEDMYESKSGNYCKFVSSICKSIFCCPNH